MDNPITHLCAALEKHLVGDGASRFGHHLDQVAPETWIVLEAAYLVNSPSYGVLTGWKALAEVSRVDLTLENLDTAARVFLEFKLVSTNSWNANWTDVVADLRKPDGSNKPIAHASVCLVMNYLDMPPKHPAKFAEYNHRFHTMCELRAGASHTIIGSVGEPLATTVVYSGDVHTASWTAPVANWKLMAFAVAASA